MSDTTATAALRGWLNKTMKLILHIPGLQKAVGGSVALLTFRGRKTAILYTIPVSYRRFGNEVVALTDVSRRWWRNFESNPHVGLRLAGQVHTGIASAGVGDDTEVETLRRFLHGRRLDARAHGVSLESDGTLSEAEARRLLPKIVVIRVRLDNVASQPIQPATPGGA